MAKFIVTQTDRYEIEAENLEDAQIYWRNELLTGISSGNEFIDGSSVYEKIEEKVNDYGCCPFCDSKEKGDE